MSANWPDPERGVFTTMRIQKQRVLALSAHFARLEASVSAIYGRSLPDNLTASLPSNPTDDEQIRIDVTPTSTSLSVSVHVSPRRLPPPELRLQTVPVSTWAGEHKWIDRPVLDGALIVDAQHVVELNNATVYAVFGSTLVTPATGMLPGIARAAVLSAAERLNVTTEVRPLNISEFRNADAVLASNAVRGLMFVDAIDDRHWSERPAVFAELQDHLENGGWDIDAETWRRFIPPSPDPSTTLR